MSSRENEQALLDKCILVALSDNGFALPHFSALDANVFMVASKLVKYSHPIESERLRSFATSYFEKTGTSPTSSDVLLKNGSVPGLPRFRQMLELSLNKAKP